MFDVCANRNCLTTNRCRMHPVSNKCVLLSAECDWSIRSIEQMINKNREEKNTNVHRLLHIAEV